MSRGSEILNVEVGKKVLVIRSGLIAIVRGDNLCYPDRHCYITYLHKALWISYSEALGSEILSCEDLNTSLNIDTPFESNNIISLLLRIHDETPVHHWNSFPPTYKLEIQTAASCFSK